MDQGMKAAKWLFVALMISMFYQNCGDDVGFNEVANSENPFGFGQTRKLILDPNLADNRPPIQLTTIVDNSNSTQYIQDNLNSGFANAIGQVQGFNVNASLHTMSHDTGKDKPVVERVDLVSFKDSNGDEVVLPMSDRGLIPANTNYVEKEVFQLTPSLFSGGKSLSYRFSKDDFEVFKQTYTSGISSLGTDGSPDELGLCTLFKKIEHNRQVEDPDNLAYHLYILATNEDDFTTLANCPVETRKETNYIQTSIEENCSAGDPGCRFSYTIEQNPVQSQSASIALKYNKSTVKVHYEGTQIKETISGSKSVSSHSISYQEREATYSYKVNKTCYNDGVPEDCPVETRSASRVNGACSVGSERNCSGTEKSEAAALFGVSASSLRSCKISCSDQFYSRDLPGNKVPSPNGSCTSSPLACNSSDLSAVLSDSGNTAGNINNCSRTCSTSNPSDSIASYNQRSSCGTTSRSCNSSERQSLASKLGVASTEVNNCSYTCQEKSKSGSKTRTSYNGSCNASDTRVCGQDDKSFLMGEKPGFSQSNLNSCDVRCTTDAGQSTNVTISTSGLTCPSSNVDCSGGQKTLAASSAGVQVSDVNSCKVSCNVINDSQPSCSLSDITDLNLCSNNSQVASLCASKGRTDLNFGSCSRSVNGKVTTTTTTVDNKPKVTVAITDLDGVDPGQSLTEIVAARLRRTHGEKGFYTSFFIHPSDDPSCTPPPNLSIGAKYEDLSTQLGGNNASTFPVCSNDYSPALDSIISIAIQNVLNTFNLAVKETEKVFKVEAIYLDDSKEVVPESEYEVFKKTIIFNNKEFLKDVKTLEISVWEP